MAEEVETSELEYALRYGDEVLFSKTNTYALKDFHNATNHAKLLLEVNRARALKKTMREETDLRIKHGYIPRTALEDTGADIPESELLVAFSCWKLKKNKVAIWSVKEYPHAVAAAAGRSRGAAARAAAPPARQLKAIAREVSREEWSRLIVKFSEAHNGRNPPPGHGVGDDDGLDDGDEAATKKRRRGAHPMPISRPWVHPALQACHPVSTPRCPRLRPACSAPLASMLTRVFAVHRFGRGLAKFINTMLGLADIETHYLRDAAPRVDSVDPQASMEAKVNEIKNERAKKAEAIHAAGEKEKARKVRPPRTCGAVPHARSAASCCIRRGRDPPAPPVLSHACDSLCSFGVHRSARRERPRRCERRRRGRGRRRR